MRSPLGKNEIGKFLPTAVKNAGLQGRVTCISRLLNADVPDNFVTQLSGHRSLKSLDAYKSASHEHQRRMSLTSVESATFHPLQMGPGLFSGATIGSFNNCTFNIQLTSGQLCTTEPSDSSSKRPRIGESDKQMK